MNVRNEADSASQIQLSLTTQTTAAAAASRGLVKPLEEPNGATVATRLNGATDSIASAAGASSHPDSAHLSATASQVSESSAGSEVRLDKVAAIQNALAQGSYHVAASDVATKVVDTLLNSDKG